MTTDAITDEPVAAGDEPKQRHPLLIWAWSLVRLEFLGIAFGAVFFCLSLTPSLLPRDWLFQGLIGGVTANDTAMIAEPVVCCDHAWNILNAAHTQVGIGIVYVNGTEWMTEDFIG